VAQRLGIYEAMNGDRLAGLTSVGGGEGGLNPSVHSAAGNIPTYGA
jgi:hypothetical protein